MSKQKKFLTGALVLSSASLLTKILSAIYKVPFQNLTGNQGFYVYQQLYPFYGLAVALGLTGLPMFVSKIVSEAKTDNEIKENLSHLFSWLALFSVLVFLALQFFSLQISGLMGDQGLKPAIESLSYVFLFTPFLSISRGFFQGRVNMLPTALSQLGEQLIRVGILLTVAYLFTINSWSVYEMGQRAMASSWIAALISFTILLYFLIKHQSISLVSPSGKALFSKKMGKRLATEGIEITVISSIMVFFQFIDSFTVYNGLINGGYPDNIAMALKGIYDRGQPFVQLGLVAGLSFSTSFLPILRKNFMEKEWKEWNLNAVSILRLTTIISGAATVGLIAIMPWLNHALFSDFNGIGILQMFVVSVFLSSLILSLQSIVQSTGLKSNTLVAIFSGLGFKLLLNEFIVQRIGLMGSSTVTVMSLVFVLIIMAFQIPSKIWKDLMANSFIIKWLINLALLFILVFGGLTGLQAMAGVSNRLISFFFALAGAGVGAIVYLIIAVKWKLLTKYETEQLPFSRFFRKLD